MRLILGIRHWADDPGIRGRLYQYALLMRLHKPIGIFLLLWPTLWSLWMASAGKPDPLVLTVFVLGVILMRSAGCIINDYADRHIDPHVERTRGRPLASGLVTEREALSLFVVLCLVAFGLVLFMNALTIILSLIAVVIAAAYPFMKRYTYLPQVVLGAAFAMAVPMAWAAQAGEVPRAVWLLFTATVVWTTAYDTMYAIVDRDDDLKIGVKSTAILFGDMDRPIIAILQLLTLLALAMAGEVVKAGAWYYAGLSLAAVLAGYQQYLIRNHDRGLCFRAFLNNNWFGLLVFAGLVMHYR